MYPRLPFALYSNNEQSQALSCQLDNAVENSTPVPLSLNSATGNLQIFEPGLTVVMNGIKQTIGFRFNSKKENQNWTLSSVQTIKQLSPNTIELQECDGLPVNFELDEKSGVFKPAKGYKPAGCFIKKANDNGFILYDDTKTPLHYFNHEGLLTKKITPSGNAITYHYQNGRLTKIKGGNEAYYLNWQKGRLSIEQETSPNTFHSLAEFIFAEEDCKSLKTVCLQAKNLEPFKRHYQQKGEELRIEDSLKQSCTLEFEQQQLKRLVQENSELSINYQDKKTSISSNLCPQARITLEHDERAHLISAQTGEFSQHFDFGDELELNEIRQDDGVVHTWQTNAQGQWLTAKTFDKDQLISEQRRTIDNGLILTSSQLLIEKDELLTTYYLYEEGLSQTPRLRFSIAPGGEVTEYCYEHTNLVAQTIHYTNERFQLEPYNEQHRPSLEDLERWQHSLTNPQRLVKDYEYDERLQLQETLCGSNLHATAFNQFGELEVEESFNDNGQSIKRRKVYDNQGCLMRDSDFNQHERLSLRLPMPLQAPYPQALLEIDEHEALLEHLNTQALNARVATEAAYLELTHQANDLFELTFVNSHEQCLTKSGFELTEGKACLLKTEAFYYQNHPHPIIHCDDNNHLTFHHVDEQGRPLFELNELGELVTFEYNDSLRLHQTTRFASRFSFQENNLSEFLEEVRGGQALSIENWQSLLSSLSDFSTQLRSTDNELRTSFEIIDAFGNPRFMVDEEGFCIEHHYNSLNQDTGTTQYASALSASDIDVLKRSQTLPDRVLLDEENRNTHSLYQKGQKAYSIDAAGYITKHQHDGAGREVKKSELHAPLSKEALKDLSLERLEKITLEQEANQSISHTYCYFNDEGLNDVCVDAKGTLTLKTFNNDSQCVRQQRFETPIELPLSPFSRPQLPKTSPNDLIIEYLHDDNGNPIREKHSSDGLKIERSFDKNNKLSNEQSSDATLSDKTGDTFREKRFALDKLGRVIDSFNPSIALALRVLEEQLTERRQMAAPTLFSWPLLSLNYWLPALFPSAHDEQAATRALEEEIEALKQKSCKKTYRGSLLESESDAKGALTHFCYDKAGRELARLSPMGVLTRTITNAFSETIETRTYTDFVKNRSPEQLRRFCQLNSDEGC